MVALFGCQANAGVRDGDGDPIAFACDAQTDRASVARVFHGIRQQVVDRSPQEELVGGWLDATEGLGENVLKLDWTKIYQLVVRLKALQVEDVVHQTQHVVAGGRDRGEIALLTLSVIRAF